jgi:hypothetical protein
MALKRETKEYAKASTLALYVRLAPDQADCVAEGGLMVSNVVSPGGSNRISRCTCRI